MSPLRRLSREEFDRLERDYELEERAREESYHEEEEDWYEPGEEEEWNALPKLRVQNVKPHRIESGFYEK